MPCNNVSECKIPKAARSPTPIHESKHYVALSEQSGNHPQLCYSHKQWHSRGIPDSLTYNPISPMLCSVNKPIRHLSFRYRSDYKYAYKVSSTYRFESSCHVHMRIESGHWL